MNECFELHREKADGRMAVELVSENEHAVRERAQRLARRYHGRRVQVAVFRDGFLVDTEDYTCVRRAR